VHFVDTHCHLNLNSLQGEIELVLQRAYDKGLDHFLIPGTNLETSRQAVELAEKYPSIYAAVGVHPNDANLWDANTLSQLEALAAHPKVLAIGEIGLDFYRDWAAPELQIEILQQQLILATRLNKPIIIHCRQAMQQLWPIVRNWQKSVEKSLIDRSGVFHSFDSDFIIASEIISCGFFIGVSGPVTYKNAQERQKTIGLLPLDRIVLETDAPYLTPHPHRGKTNEPANIPIIAEKIAELKQCSLEQVALLTSKNAENLFRWKV
jgi:TatD DNase family protein